MIKAYVLTLTACLCLGYTASASAAPKAKSKWVEQAGAKLTHARMMDGDSFGMELKSAKGNPIVRTYRLYGVDCPESDGKDKILKKRIEEQAKCFGRTPEEILKLGKEASKFTGKLLVTGKPRILTRGMRGQEAAKSPGRPQRYYAIVEVTGPDGKRHLLHELLLENGLARAWGKPAAWPPEEEARHGEKAACDEFEKRLKRMEAKAKAARVGAWKKVHGGKWARPGRHALPG